MDRSCDVCGQSYVAKRASSRYCSERCRKRAQRVPVVPVAPVTDISDRGGDRVGQMEVTTVRELAAAGMLDSSLGAAALVLARRLDSVTADTGSSIASMVREHRATLSAAVSAGVVVADPVDELNRKRQARLG